MTLLGKILVLVNFALSVMVMVWAMMLRVDHVDWTLGTKDQPGELAPRDARVKDAWASLAAAEASWRDNRADVLEQEDFRVADRPWYEAELKHARSEATDQK